MASIVAARRGKDVTIFEHKDKVGRKILATGNGDVAIPISTWIFLAFVL